MLLIKNGLLYTMEENKPRKADVLIKDGKIEEIADFIAPTEQMQVLDAKDKRVFPGFIDVDSHIGIAEERSTQQLDPSNEGTNPTSSYTTEARLKFRPRFSQR